MRYLGIDYGGKHIGLALGDYSPEQKLSAIVSPLMTLQVSDVSTIVDRIRAICLRQEIAELVLGLPLDKEGRVGAQGKVVQKFGELLERRVGKPVRYWDETLSSYAALHKMIGGGLGQKDRRKRKDEHAAGVILQEYLDSLAT